MSRDYRLLDEALEALLKTRSWLSAEYYKMNINPVVLKLKERLASYEVSKLVIEKKIENFETVDWEPNTIPSQLENKSTFEFKAEPNTIPSKLLESVSNFGLFNESKLNSDYCKKHANAPHKYLKELSVAMGRYVCQCEFWHPDK